MAESLPLVGPGISTTRPAAVTLRVVGHPAPQGSKKAFRNKHTGRIQQVESSKAVTPWRMDVRQTVEQQAPDARFAAPVHVALTFWFTRPKGHYRTGRNAHLLRDAAPAFPAGQKNDVDKLARSTLDALTSAGLLEDDGQVVELLARKLYALQGEPSGADITVRGMA